MNHKQITTVGQLITQLQSFPHDREVIITDGYQAVGYRGKYQVVDYVDHLGNHYVDIGIGGLDEVTDSETIT